MEQGVVNVATPISYLDNATNNGKNSINNIFKISFIGILLQLRYIYIMNTY